MTAMWEPGRLYAPGDIVTPRLTDPITQDKLTNADFEGAGGWDETGLFEITTGDAFEGTDKIEVIAPGFFCAVANADDDDNIARSTDGITWTPESIDAGTIFAGSAPQIAFAERLDKFMVGVQSGFNSKFGFQSADRGATWSEIVPTGDIPLTGCRALKWIPELNKMFFAVGGEGLFSSFDLTAWTEGTTPFTGVSPVQIAYDPVNNIMIVAVSTGTTIFRSTDGGDVFTSQTIGFGVGSVIFMETLGLFVAVESGSRDVSTSTDGLTWVTTSNALPVGISPSRNALAYSPSQDRIVVVDSTSPFAAFSDDGVTWVSATTIPSLGWSAVIYDSVDDQFVACELGGGSSSFMTSPTGVTWTERTTTTAGTGGWADIAFGKPPIDDERSENTARLPVEPGQTVSASAKVKLKGTSIFGQVAISYHGTADVLIQTDFDDQIIIGTSSAYRSISVFSLAPIGALTASVTLVVNGTGDSVFFDDVQMSYANPVTISEFLFKAVQALAGYSDSFEPAWPTILGNTVIDNEVTWEAIDVNRVVWRSTAILVSGLTEPTFPATIDGLVADNTIVWKAQTRRVEDENCPNTKEVAIVASKVFAADKDIIPFSATVNPLDWTTSNDAGFIPFGLNTYGSQDVSALGLYRSNLVAFNSKGFQMWQVDEDPANFAILDAVPIGVPDSSHLSIQPVSNDLVFLTEAGIRSMGIAGASTNLQAGFFGKQIDPLVLAAFKTATRDPLGLFYPGQGQYWLIFDAEAFVLTMNGGKQDMSWSRYTFPANIDDWTILNKKLFLRAGDEVWELSPDATLDQETAPNTGTDFIGEVWWQYLDFGGLGDQKMMHGFDLVGKGACTITFGYDQSNDTLVTADYVLTDIDTLPGTMIPMPISGPSFQMRLTFSADNDWEWTAAAIYLDDQRTTS